MINQLKQIFRRLIEMIILISLVCRLNVIQTYSVLIYILEKNHNSYGRNVV